MYMKEVIVILEDVFAFVSNIPLSRPVLKMPTSYNKNFPHPEMSVGATLETSNNVIILIIQNNIHVQEHEI